MECTLKGYVPGTNASVFSPQGGVRIGMVDLAKIGQALVNEGDDVDRELRIWMNNPLRYARRTFYQSGYLPNDGGTVLQVVRNDSWMIPYLACMIVFVGMAGQFVQSLRDYQRRAA